MKTLTHVTGRLCSRRSANPLAVTIVALFMGIGFVGAPLAYAQATGTVNFTSTLQAIDGFGLANPFGRGGYVQQSPWSQRRSSTSYSIPTLARD